MHLDRELRLQGALPLIFLQLKLLLFKVARYITRSFFFCYTKHWHFVDVVWLQGFSEDESKFANVGIAIRGGIGSNNVLGFYTFYDYLNSSYGNKFHQVSAGIESISDFIEARVNGYLPIKDRRFEELKLQNQDEKPVIKFNKCKRLAAKLLFVL